MMSTLFVLLFYSSGMPVLYLLGLLFFAVTYFVNKMLFFNYYQRTDSSLSRDLPIFSIKILKVAVVFKLILGLFMYSDASIWESRLSLDQGGGKALPD